MYDFFMATGDVIVSYTITAAATIPGELFPQFPTAVTPQNIVDMLTTPNKAAQGAINVLQKSNLVSGNTYTLNTAVSIQ